MKSFLPSFSLAFFRFRLLELPSLFVFLPYIGLPFLFSTDRQPTAPILALSALLFCRSRTSAKSKQLLYYCSFVFAFILLAGFYTYFYCYSDLDVFRQLLSYFFGFTIVLFASLYPTKDSTSRILDVFILIVFIGFALNFFTGGSITSLLVNRNIVETGTATQQFGFATSRGFPSFFSEQSALSTVFVSILPIALLVNKKINFYLLMVFALLISGSAQSFFELSFVAIICLISYLLAILTICSYRVKKLALLLLSFFVSLVIFFLSVDPVFIAPYVSGRLLQALDVFKNPANLSLLFGYELSVKLNHLFVTPSILYHYPLNICINKYIDPTMFYLAFDSARDFGLSILSEYVPAYRPYTSYSNLLIDLSLLGAAVVALCFYFFVLKSSVLTHVNYVFPSYPRFFVSRTSFLVFIKYFIILLSAYMVIGKGSIGLWPHWFLLGFLNNKNIAFHSLYVK